MAAEPGVAEEKLALARAATRSGNDAEALKALQQALKESKKAGHTDSLREVAALAEELRAPSSSAVAKEAAHVAYAASQNVRLLERRAAVAANALPTSPAPGVAQHPIKRAPKPTPVDWLLGIGWLGLCIAAGIVGGDAYAETLVGEWSTRDFLLGFEVIPLALGVVAGFVIRPQAPFLESLPVASAGAIVLGFTMALQPDLSPGSEACPTGCEEDRGWVGVPIIVITILPLIGGMLLGRLSRRFLMRPPAPGGSATPGSH
jgi:hypothetical protein